MLGHIDTSLIDWSRAQFALTAIYHWIFVPLTLGLAVIMGIMETAYYRTGDEFWKRTAKFWMKIFGINFAIGVATGIILEFEFGTNWRRKEAVQLFEITDNLCPATKNHLCRKSRKTA